MSVLREGGLRRARAAADACEYIRSQLVQQSLSRAITDYQDGYLSLDQLRQQIENEVKTADGVQAVRSLLETANQSLPHAVRDLLTDFSDSCPGVTNLRMSTIGVGSVLRGRYRLVREIGRGGMGTVYLADGLVDFQQFAVKVLNAEFLKYPDAVRVFREEARKCLALRHPNIVGVYPLECEGDQYYLPMEYLEGKTIRELLDQDFARGVPADQAWPIVKGAGAALAFAHDQGVIHSDLKPSNIFVTTGGRARVLDFGIARALRDRRHYDTDALGAITAAYASCEMLARKPPDFRDDVYSFACVVYELLTGNHPFGGRTASEASAHRMVVAPVRALTQAQNAVLRRGLAFNCDDRVPTIEEFLTVCGGNDANVTDPRTGPPLEVRLPDYIGLRFCAVCGKELSDIARFCPGCGTSCGAETEVPTSVTEDPQIRGEYRPAGPDKPKPRLLPKLDIFWATSIAAGVAIGFLAVYMIRLGWSPSTYNAPVPVAGNGLHVEGPSAGDALRRKLTAAAVAPSNATTEKSDGLPTEAAPAQPVAATSDLVAAATGPGDVEVPVSASTTEPAPRHPVFDKPAAGTNRSEDVEHPPVGKHVAPFKLAEDSPAVDEACPYPAAAKESGEAGTVALLVYIAADGSPTSTVVESSSGSKLLDDAAVDCVAQNLRFVPKRVTGAAVGSWARLRFKWSFDVGE